MSGLSCWIRTFREINTTGEYDLTLRSGVRERLNQQARKIEKEHQYYPAPVAPLRLPARRKEYQPPSDQSAMPFSMKKTRWFSTNEPCQPPPRPTKPADTWTRLTAIVGIITGGMASGKSSTVAEVSPSTESGATSSDPNRSQRDSSKH